MRRLRILIGHVSEETYTDGSQSFNESVISGLKEVADVSLVVTNYWGKKRPGPLVEETVHVGLPAIMVRPRTELAFDLTQAAPSSEEVAEGQYLAQRIADFALKQGVDVIHILQWGHLKGCLFEAALRANIPFVHTPYEYWSVCPQFFLRHYGRTICSGPDDLGRKCWDCITHLHSFPAVAEEPSEERPYLVPRKTFLQLLPYRINGRLQWLLKSKLMMKIFGPGWSPLFGANFAGQWKIALHLRALRHYLSHAARILPMNPTWGQELSKHLRIPIRKFTVCPPGTFNKTTKLPKGGRFNLPLQFGHPHRVSYQGGAYFVLEAWRKARIPPAKGILHIYGAEGDRHLLGRTVYSALIESGSVMVHEGRIANRLDEVFMPLAAVITGYQWKVGACGNGEAIARGIPTISSRWDYVAPEKESILREGVNALLYDRWDSDSLAGVLHACTEKPALLEKLYETCELPPGFTHEDFIGRYLRVYEDVLADKSKT